MATLERITRQPGVMGGKPCIRGLQMTVGMIVGQSAAGASIPQLLTEYPYLKAENIAQALQYAAGRVQGR